MNWAWRVVISGRRALSLIWREATPYVRVRFSLALALVCVTSVVTALGPVALKVIVDSLAAGGAHSAPFLLLLLAAYVLSQWLARALGEVRSYIHAQADRRMCRTLSQKLFSHILDLPLRYHLERRTGALSETLTNGLAGYQIVLSLGVYTLIPILVELTTVAVILVSLKQSVFLIVFAPALLAYFAAFARGTVRIVAAARRASAAQVDERAVMTDGILNYETVKYFAAEALVKQRFDVALSQTETNWVGFFKNKTITGLAISVVFAMFLAVSSAYALRLTLSGQMTVGDFVLVNTYIFQLLRPIEALGFAVQGLAQGIALLEGLMDITDVAPESQAGGGVGFSDGGGTLEFVNVSVSYRREQEVLRDVSFTLPSGHTLGIVGASGTGKSTLVRLLVRLLEPERGRILLDGIPLCQVSLPQLRRAISVVPQDAVLFNDTIGYNIAFGKPGSSQVEIENAAKLARLHDFIISLPEGYETPVGERGLKLSGGERQRVAIARAALKQPRIYVFDEATSSLDSRAEGEILDNLTELARSSTTLIIAHRLSTVIHADQIIVIDDGVVAERGTHSELLAANGKYAALWSAQLRSASARAKLSLPGTRAVDRSGLQGDEAVAD